MVVDGIEQAQVQDGIDGAAPFTRQGTVRPPTV